MADGLSAGVTVLIAILCAAALVAVGAAMHRVYSARGRPNDPESRDAFIAQPGNEQQNYMRDVRMRSQLQAWGQAPAYDGGYDPPRSQVGFGRGGSRGGETATSFGYT